MSIETLAMILATAHIGSAIFIGRVIQKQYRLVRLPLQGNYTSQTIKDVKHFRLVLLALSLVIFFGNIIPVAIDVITLATDNSLGRNPSVRPISIMYAVSNALTALVSAFLVWIIYRNTGARVIEGDTIELSKEK